jgi:hypothetical protein
VTKDDTRDSIAALELARAQIETVLGRSADWLALRRADGPARLAHELALAANPHYRSWQLLNEAIRVLRAEGALGHEARPAAGPDDLTRIRGISAALARRLADLGTTRVSQIAAWRADDVRRIAEALGLGRTISRQNWIEQAALLELRRRSAASDVPARAPAPAAKLQPAARIEARGIDLHQVLQHIRDAAAQHGDAPPPEAPNEVPASPEAAMDDGNGHEIAAASQQGPEAHRSEAVDVTPDAEGAGRLVLEPEEATVTFVIRESAPAPSTDGDSVERGPQDAPLSDQWTVVAAPDPLNSPTEVEEAEVVIVSRHPGPRSGNA